MRHCQCCGYGLTNINISFKYLNSSLCLYCLHPTLLELSFLLTVHKLLKFGALVEQLLFLLLIFLNRMEVRLLTLLQKMEKQMRLLRSYLLAPMSMLLIRSYNNCYVRATDCFFVFCFSVSIVCICVDINRIKFLHAIPWFTLKPWKFISVSCLRMEGRLLILLQKMAIQMRLLRVPISMPRLI